MKNKSVPRSYRELGAYLPTIDHPARIERSDEKGSFAMSERLVTGLPEIAESSGTTVAAIVREAIRDYGSGRAGQPS